MNNKQNPTKAKSTKKGGNFTEDISKLAVPFGILLAKKALEKHLKTVRKTAVKPTLSAKSQKNTTPSPKTIKQATSSKKSKNTPDANNKQSSKKIIRRTLAVGGGK